MGKERETKMTTILEAYRAPSYVGGNPSIEALTAWAFRAHRRAGKPACAALELARADAAGGKHRYSTHKAGYGTSGRAWSAFGESHMRWIENPSVAGLRFVGFADDLARIGHNGWYLSDDNWTGETVRGVVFQMAARDGRAQYVAGYDNAINGAADRGGPVALSFDEIFEGEQFDESDSDAKSGAARRADGIAEAMAESERDYNRAWEAGNRFVEIGETVAETRRAALALIAEIKAKREAICDGPAIVAALRDRLEAMLDDIKAARVERAELANGFDHTDAFRDVVAGKA